MPKPLIERCIEETKTRLEDCLCSLRKGSKSMSLRYTTKENKNELKKKERTKLF